MALFSFKPQYIDFGHEPSTQTVKFIHESAVITVVAYPEWVERVSVNYTTYVSGSPLGGTLTAIVRGDVPTQQYSGVIELLCDLESVYIPVIYRYDSAHVRVRDIIDTVMIMGENNAFFSPMDRHKALLAAKRWMQDNAGAGGTNLRFAELMVENNVVKVPGDFIDYVGLYVVSRDGYLRPLYKNDKINIAEGYLKDEDSTYVLDEHGFVISAMGLTPRVSNGSAYSYLGKNMMDAQFSTQTLNIKPGEVSFNGVYRFDRTNNEFIINGYSLEKVVLEYLSDPITRIKMKMDVGELRIHKNYQEALEYYIYYKLIEINNKVPLYEKRRALQTYKLAYKRANMKRLNVNELIQVLRGNKYIQY